MNSKEKRAELQSILSIIDENCCPNFFLTGRSYSSLEKRAIDLADEIQKRKLVDFSGTKQDFSIVIPYFNEPGAAKSFVDRLAESISIARDCYYQYRGIVIIEFDKEWSKRGINNPLRTVFDYIKSQKELCFILLAINSKESDYISSIYNELCSMDLWLPLEVESASPEECLDYVKATAGHFKLSIPEDVSEALLKMFRQRDETNISNEEAAESLVKQILFKRLVNSNHSPEIDISEISYLNSSSRAHFSRQIGFIPDNR
ncbi:MAG: hypothetical protein LUG86_04915 [Oscillospiraceae bacterium]|nr:hypothetical protein [Oscillospiraceae bacterium]